MQFLSSQQVAPFLSRRIFARNWRNASTLIAEKTKALGKKARRQNHKHRVRLGHAIKSNITGEKLSWFLGQIDEGRTEPLTPQELEDLIELYFTRFDEELEQINLKQSIGKHRANQHAARKDVITMTLEKERNEFRSGGLELMNLCDPLKLKTLREWDGSALSVQHLKLDLVSHNMLQRLKVEQSAKEEQAANSEQMET
ncbi:hypothetical protein M5D96_013810 [Drosophila gunungcola]|uniref:Translation machinery-associated protein 16 homolog n=1 Tax=Drosophila gunungcola TaxID=103775 RepID=A0A9P9YAL1_9MUSC|nr:hypothetical protein M5D96_013810 [Drosophila gunungcola]